MDTIPGWLVSLFLWSPLVLAALCLGIDVWRRGKRDQNDYETDAGDQWVIPTLVRTRFAAVGSQSANAEANEPRMKSRVIEALETLAAPADQQRRWVEDAGTAPLLDELALELHDALKSPEGEMMLSRAPEEIRRVDEHLLSFSGASYEELWTVDALTLPEWEEARQLARAALAAVRESPQAKT